MNEERATHEVADGYRAAMAELERILGEIESEDVDVDLLTERVARAAELIRFCRERISEARLHVDQIVSDLDASTEPAGGKDSP